MNTHADRRIGLRAWLQACVIALLINLLVFPPGLLAQTQVSLSWIGASDNWSNLVWSCTSNCGSSYDSNWPDNNVDPAYTYLANISTNDTVTLDNNTTTASSSGIAIDGLTLGNGSTSSQLTISSNTLTIGGSTTAPAGSLTINGGGTLNVQNGGTLVLQDLNASGDLNIISNAGNITVNGGGSLQLNDGGNGNTFDFQGQGGITLSGGQITGTSGYETLINDTGHTISGAGSISGLLGVTNNGTLNATATNSLTIAANSGGAVNLNNWNSATQTLAGGTYLVGAGASLNIQGNNGGQILNLFGANIDVEPSGTLSLGGDSSNNGATVNPFSQLTNVTNSNLTLGGFGTGTTTSGAFAIAPTSGPPTLTVSTVDNGTGTGPTQGGLTIGSSASGGASNVWITDGLGNNAALTNTVNTNNAPAYSTPDSSTLTVQNGSTLTAGALNNTAYVGGFFNGQFAIQQGNANVNVTGASTLNVDSLTTYTNNGFGYSNINISGGSTLNVTGNVYQGGGAGTSFPISAGIDTLTIDNSTASVGGNFSNNNALNSSNVIVQDGGSLTVSGTFSQTQGQGSQATSTLTITGGSQVSVGGLTNSTYAFALGTPQMTPQSQISIMSGGSLTGSSLTITNTNGFTNISPTGVLTGGSYQIGQNSTLNYSGPSNITAIGFNTALTLDNEGGGNPSTTGAILNNGADAISNSLAVNNGVLTVQNGAQLVLNPGSGSFTNNGTANVLNGSTLDLSQTNFTNVETLTTGPYKGATALSGGTLEIGSGSQVLLSNTTPAITLIAPNTTLILDNTQKLGTGVLSNGGDAIGGSLTNNLGTLTLQNNATETLSAASFTNLGALNVLNNSTLTIANLASVNSTGSLISGSYDISNGSTLTYGGAGINLIGQNASVTIDGGTSLLTNGSGNALSGLTEVDGALHLLNGASLDISGNAAFNNVSSTGTLQYGALEVGDNSTFKYNGTDIQTIAAGASLTLDGNWTLQSTAGVNPDAVSNTLTSVQGYLGVLNGATLNLTQAFQNVNDLNDPNNPNCTSGTLCYGSLEIGNNAKLTYVGPDINTIASGSSLTLDGNWSLKSNSGNPDALSATLTTLDGALTLQNGAGLTLTGAQGSFSLTPNGALTLMNGGALNVSATSFGNVSESGNLTGNYQIGANSVLYYSGQDISSIDSTASLVIDNAGGGNPGSIQNNFHDALANSLITNNGYFALTNYAYMTLSGGGAGTFTNSASGNMALNNMSSLTVQGTFINNGNLVASGGGNTLAVAGITNNGGIYAEAGGSAALLPTLTIDTTNGGYGGTFSNSSSGTVSVADGLTLTLQNFNGANNLQSSGNPQGTNLTGGSTAVFNNDGAITIGQSTGATLLLNDGGNGTTFDLTSQNGTGTLTMNGTSYIQGANGTESLINDGSPDNSNVQRNHTIDVNGFSTIQNLAYFQNNGIINVGSSGAGGCAGSGTCLLQNLTSSSSFVPPTLTASLTIDTTAANGNLGFSNTFGYNSNTSTYSSMAGAINVADGAGLILQNTSNVATALFNNDGNINIGNTTGAYLALNSNGNNTAFDIGSQNSSGAINLNGSSTIYGVSGAESLINDTGHSIYVSSGGSGAIVHLAGFDNEGYISAGSAQGAGNLSISGVGSFLNGYFNNSAEIDAYGNLSIASPNFYNNGVINSYGGNITLNTTGTQNSFTNDYYGVINQADGTTLTLRNVSGATPGTATIENEGIIDIGSASGASLVLDSSTGLKNAAGTKTTFDLVSYFGGGTLNFVGTSTVQGATGTESLINDVGHTIVVGATSDAYGDYTVLGGTTTVSSLAGFTNNGIIYIGEGVPQTCLCEEPSPSVTTHVNGPSTLTIDTTSGGTFSNAVTSYTVDGTTLYTPGQIYVNDGSYLVFQNLSGNTTSSNTAIFNNDGYISLGTGAEGGAYLQLNSGGNKTTFDLTSQNAATSGGGILVLEGASTISGATGAESLINDSGHTIGVDTGANATIYNLASFTNNGSVLVGDPTAETPSSAALTFDTSNGGKFYNSSTGFIGLTDDSSLTFRHASADSSNPDLAKFTNDGQIVLGPNASVNDGGILYLDSTNGADGASGTGTKFLVNGSGSLTMYGTESGIQGFSGTETLINGSSQTIIAGGGSVATIGSLAAFYNHGTLQVGDSYGAGSLTIDTGNSGATASIFSNSSTGKINVQDGSTLTFQNTQNTAAAFNNNGAITLGTSSGGASLVFNGSYLNSSLATVGVAFDLTSSAATGTLVMNGTSSISGGTSYETLINDTGHTISSNGTGSISNLASFTNNGTINVAAGSLSISTGDDQFTNTGAVNVGSTFSSTSENVTHDAFETSPGVLNVAGSVINSGVVTIMNGSSLDVNGVKSDGASHGAYTQQENPNAETNIEAGGVLSINTADYLFTLDAGLLTGGGYLEANLDQEGGTLNPGDPQSFTIGGNYTLTGGALDFDLAGFDTAGVDYDQVIVDGGVTIDPGAELEITIDPSFLSQLQATLQDGGQADFTDVLQWDQGTLGGLLLANPDYMGYDLSLVVDPQNSDEADLLVSSASSATPEPGTLPLLLGALLIGCGITWNLRRRRRENRLE